MVGRVLTARRGDSRFGQEHEGEVVLGENFPLITLKGGQRAHCLGFGSQVYGRFSLTDSKSALISTDWVVGLNTTAGFDRWALTLEVYHESSHLGDEYGDRFPADRLDWTREVLAGWASYTVGSVAPQCAGQATWWTTSSASLLPAAPLAWTTWEVPPPPGRAGAAYRRAFPEAEAATEWRVSTSAKLGMAFATAGTHDIGVGLIAHTDSPPSGSSTGRRASTSDMELRFDL